MSERRHQTCERNLPRFLVLEIRRQRRLSDSICRKMCMTILQVKTMSLRGKWVSAFPVPLILLLCGGCSDPSLSSDEVQWPHAKVELATTASPRALSPDLETTSETAESSRSAEPLISFQNSIGLRMVTLPGGRVLIGSPESDSEAQPDEKPQHWADVKGPFSIGVYEVTFGEFRKFVAATGYETMAERENMGFAFNSQSRRLEPKAGSSWKSTGFLQTDDHPVINVAYEDAMAFCDWLTTKEPLRYRLPSELEWEYACRGGTTTKWSCGDSVESLKDYSNLCDSKLQAAYPFATWSVEWSDGFAFTAPVGTFRPNPFGLYDMHGNVFEWCADFWPEVGYDGLKLPPSDEPIPSGARITRGGSFLSLTTFTRSADRVCLQPQIRNCIVGFRVVCTDKEPPDAKQTGELP